MFKNVVIQLTNTSGEEDDNDKVVTGKVDYSPDFEYKISKLVKDDSGETWGKLK